METSDGQKCACEKKKSGISKGILYGLLPHTFCILFIIFSILSITTLSSLLKPFLSGRYSFLILVILSFFLATVSAIIYLKRGKLLSWHGAREKWKYLFSLYASVVLVNFAMIYLVFPALANTNFDKGGRQASVVSQSYSSLTLRVAIPCSGHALLIIDELKKANSVKDVKFRLPNYFDVYYDAKTISEEQILSLPIFKEFSAQKVVN
jgi:hypothetical protein